LKKFLKLPHRVCESTCYINGLEDIFMWKGAEYMPFMLSVIGGMGEFSYFRFKLATPPDMVYFGANPKYLLNDLGKIIGFKQEIIENRVFKNTFPKIKEFINDGKPVVAGALDMYYLNYYPSIYHRQHIPIHYVLLVGYDDEACQVFLHDCSFPGFQVVSYEEFEKSLNVNTPGMSRKNTFRVFLLPDNAQSELDAAKKGFYYRSQKMLKPSARVLGIPAMRKLSKEIFNWEDESSFNHLITYATIPPHLPKKFDNSDGMRQWKSKVLRELGNKYGIDAWRKTADMFDESGKLIIELCKAASKRDKDLMSGLLLKIADIEESAYMVLAEEGSK